MRILAIRGCNLASLAGEFEIDLARAPFSDAGVFAIVGNTGAGKSTLLDALCVALFDRTPRLTNHSRVAVGRGDDTLGAQDVRTLLRRGAAAGWAEVDFEAGDARRYRARWSVRRARNQTDGTLQDQQVTLTSLDGGERFGGTKTETLRAIVARLGLTFDQFRRSALLAQGEFAAFLRADGKDRSELLERMTGTEIYSRLSVAAHVRASLAEQQLRDYRTKVDAIPVLADDARAAAEGELALAYEAKRAARERLAAAEALARWRGEHRTLYAAVAAAEREHAAAVGASTAADVDRAELALQRRAEQLRGVWDEAARLDRALAIARGELTTVEAALATARSHHVAIASRRARLAELHTPLVAARESPAALRPPPAADAEALAAVAASDVEWLVAHRALAAEVAAWPELDTRFAQYGALVDAIASIDRSVREHEATRARLRKAREVLAADLAAASSKLVEAQRKATTFHQRRGLTLDAARRQEDEARSRLADVERLVSIAAAAREAHRVRDEVDAQLVELEELAAADATQRVRLEADRATAIAVRSERSRIVDDLRRAAGYEHARAELRDDEPCPLCGATEHPWRSRGAFDDVIRVESLRLAESTASVDALSAALAALVARDHQRTKERDRLQRHRATAVSSSAADVTRWREQLAALGELLLEGDPSTAEAARIASELEASARSRLEQARTLFSQTQAATKAAQDAQADAQLAQAAVDRATVALADHDRRIAELDATLHRLAGERTTRMERRLELESELTTTIARWRAAAPSASASSTRSSSNRIADPSAHLASARGAPAELAAARSSSSSNADPSAHVAAARGAAAELAAARSSSSSLGDHTAHLAAARGACAELAAAWRSRADRVAAADASLSHALAQIERDERDAERSLAEHAARHTTLAQRRDALVSELRDAATRLDTARADAKFDIDELRRLLSADPSRADDLAAHLATLDRNIERTRAVVEERRARLVAHAVTRPPDATTGAPASASDAPPSVAGPPNEGDARRADNFAPPSAADTDDAADDVLDTLRALLADTEQHAARLAATLVADDDARARRTAALAAIADAEASAATDRILGEVIGSHDGKLFRSFAQSLTLDSLLAVANAHLEELAPRYQLERVPRHDLELQVIDRDLGAEVRSVQSLSGGESFLVSLALALGLSSMSAHDVRVRTLLIDEGFGTLDPATLDSALSVLDALQATGRQVGVISHVPALVERVGAHIRVVQRGGGRSEVVVA